MAHVAASEDAERPVETQADGGRERGGGLTGRNLIRTHARMSKYLPWMTDEMMLNMHYPRFFAYVEEVEKIIEEERGDPGSGGSVEQNAILEKMQLRSMTAKPMVWGGDVVNVNQRD